VSTYVPWLTLALLGAFHGLNPGMGWLFAVALGLQERSRAVVIRALGPIALGHAVSIAFVVGIVAISSEFVSSSILRTAGAGLLIAFGIYKLLARGSHPRWVGMHVGGRDLVAWSFLMSTAHGAGLMLVPVLMREPTEASAANVPGDHMGHSNHAEHLAAASGQVSSTLTDVSTVLVHTGAMFLIMGLVAIVVFDRVGLMILRRAWFNLDRVWAGALIGAGLLTFVVGM
jgi:putative Ca2+/H+ antiporter (TMEM165/GDT1 family)